MVYNSLISKVIFRRLINFFNPPYWWKELPSCCSLWTSSTSPCSVKQGHHLDWFYAWVRCNDSQLGMEWEAEKDTQWVFSKHNIPPCEYNMPYGGGHPLCPSSPLSHQLWWECIIALRVFNSPSVGKKFKYTDRAS